VSQLSIRPAFWARPFDSHAPGHLAVGIVERVVRSAGTHEVNASGSAARQNNEPASVGTGKIVDASRSKRAVPLPKCLESYEKSDPSELTKTPARGQGNGSFIGTLRNQIHTEGIDG
jgi:hypothetical protein